MDHSKNGNISETSSDENDHSSEKFNENTGTGRSYECTFCKRGFTNAQALGGHMNIHRKDKAKAKQKADQTNSSFLKRSISEDYMNSSRYFSPTTNQQTNYQVALGERMNYQQFYVPAPNPNYPPYAYYQSNLANCGLHEEHLGANLSLDIGSSNMEDGNGKSRNVREDRTEHEVDLELRLGYVP